MDLSRYGLRVEIENAAHEHAGCVIARVIAEHRGGYEVVTRQGAMLAIARGELRRDRAKGAGVVVGDWVALAPPSAEGGQPVVRAVLPRVSRIARRAAGDSGLAHTMVANVDFAIIVTSIVDDFRPRRIERYLALIADGGARPAIVLTKADLATPDEIARVEAEASSISRGTPVHVVSVDHRDSIDVLYKYFKTDSTVVFLGSSGVGKSTLVNALVGRDAQTTRGVREDGKGRHTTTARRLLEVPGGGLVIDTPGVREVGMHAEQEEMVAYDDVRALTERCRYRDCSHAGEPGCALAEAVASGEISAARVASYNVLRGEADVAKDARAKKREGRLGSKAYRAGVRVKATRD